MTPSSQIHPQSRRDKPCSFPLYLIYQPHDHYYFIKIEQNPTDGLLELSLAHSLNYNVLTQWSTKHWNGLMNYIALLAADLEQQNTAEFIAAY